MPLRHNILNQSHVLFHLSPSERVGEEWLPMKCDGHFCSHHFMQRDTPWMSENMTKLRPWHAIESYRAPQSQRRKVRERYKKGCSDADGADGCIAAACVYVCVVVSSL